MNASPLRAADLVTMASPMGPIVVDPDTSLSLGQGPSALLLTTSTPKTVESAHPPLTPTAVWGRLVQPCP